MPGEPDGAGAQLAAQARDALGTEVLLDAVRARIAAIADSAGVTARPGMTVKDQDQKKPALHAAARRPSAKAAIRDVVGV